jgi:hypothetical protein
MEVHPVLVHVAHGLGPLVDKDFWARIPGADQA